MASPSLFVSYSHRDAEALEQLRRFLRPLEREQRIAWWDDSRIEEGRDWAAEIAQALGAATAAVLLISQDFIDSEFITRTELPQLLARAEAGKLTILPVFLGHSTVELTSYSYGGSGSGAERRVKLTKYQGFGSPKKPLAELKKPQREKVYVQLVRRLTKLAAEPEPKAAVLELTQALEDAYRQKEELVTAGRETTAIDEDILALRRRIREGGPLNAGDFLADGRFKLIEQIGHGGFATVWKAYDRKTRQPVAVKVLHGQYAQDRTRRERFFRGARQMAQLQHPGVVRVIEAEGEDGGYQFFVMEYVVGGDLREAVLAERLTLEERLRIILEVGDALEHAHRKGVIHRDVKPANILLDGAGGPKLTDFDLVRALDTTGGTRDEGMLGTFLYAAPEAMENPKDAEAIADIYSLGMMAVFAIYGDELPVEVLRVANSIIAGLSCSPAVKKALCTAVDWDRRRRFPSVAAFCGALNEALVPVPETDEAAGGVEPLVLPDVRPVVVAPAVPDWVEARREAEEVDPILGALRLVGRDQDVRITGHFEVKEDRSYDERIAVIAKASGVRTRVVALRDDWWTQDQGPILGRFEESEDPVALLPKGPRAYECVDPVLGTRRAVTEELAAELHGFAYVLYRPFPDGKLTARDLVRFGARGLAKDLMMLILMGIAVGLLGVLTPYFIGRIFDSAIPEAERGLLGQFVLALVVAGAVSAAFRITQRIAVLRVQGKMDYSVQAALWDRLLNLPSTFFRHYAAGDLADRAAGINAIRGLVTDAGVASILGAFSSVFYVALMLWYSGRLAVLAMVLAFLFVGFTTVANYLQLRIQRREFEVHGRLTGMVLQLVSAVGKIRVAGAENHAFRVWSRQFSEKRRLAFRIGRIQNSVAVLSSAFPILSFMAIFYALVAIRSATQGVAGANAMSTGEFIAFSAAYALFITAMQALSDASLNLLRAVPTYERLRPIITTPAELDETKTHPGKLMGEIELAHLHFRYQEDGPWIIRDVSLRIQPGEYIAFVGASGSGKSTLMRLMLGFEIPEKGSVYYDGQDLGNLDLREVRQQLGVVLQDSRVLPVDIYRNIVGTTSRTVEEAWDAARMAGLDEDILQMPMGMDTHVSEGGGGFSGGQVQRLLIARAVVNKPRIIFMDEATSALDNRTQAIVTESLDRLQATRVVIAHRLSTIINADRICFLEAGVIREMGTYPELMAEDGLFAQLARRQMA